MNWWEGNVTMGFGGNLFAGNTGGAEYSLTPRGRLRWVHPAGQLGVVERGDRATTARVYFGSLDLTVHAVTPRGKLKWQKCAGQLRDLLARRIGRDGTVYIGSFDGALLRARPAHRSGALALRDRRPRVRLAGARAAARVHRLHRRLGVRAWTAAAGCAGATTPATPIRSSPVLGPRAARRRADPLRGLLRRQPLRARRRDAAAGAGRTTRPRATRCCATATT